MHNVIPTDLLLHGSFDFVVNYACVLSLQIIYVPILIHCAYFLTIFLYPKLLT